MVFDPWVFGLLVLPIFISASLHMVIVRWRLFAFLAFPISGRWLGENKTWRGIVVMPFLTVVGFEFTTALGRGLSILPEFWPSSFFERTALALGLGFFYVLFELPNSFLKRRLGIRAGQRSGRHVWFFSFCDQADSALGCALFYLIFLPPTEAYFWWLVILGPLIHLIGNLSLYGLGLRREAL